MLHVEPETRERSESPADLGWRLDISADQISQLLSPSRVTEESVLGIPAFKRAVELVANRIGGLELFVLDVTDKGETPNFAHKASQRLRSFANPNLSSLQLKVTITKDRLVFGNGYAAIIDDYLYRLDPTQTRVEGSGGVLVYKSWYDGRERTFLPHEVIHIKGIGDGITGDNPLVLFKRVLGGMISQQQHEEAFWRNGGYVPWHFVAPDGFKKQDYGSFVEDYKKHHAQAKNHFEPSLLPPGMTKLDAGFSPEELTLTELKKFALIEVANIIGIPASILGSEVNYSYSSLSADAKSLLDNSLEPILQDWESELQLKLLSERQKERRTHTIKFDRSKLEKTDQEKATTIAINKRKAGGLTLNEFRKAINEAPVDTPEADELVITNDVSFLKHLWEQGEEPPQPPPMALQSLEGVPEDSTEVPEEGTPEDSTDDVQERSYGKLAKSVCDRLTRRLTRAIQSKGNHNLIESHLTAFVEQTEVINDQAEEICQSYLQNLQTELDHALPEQVKPDSNQLLELLI